MAEIEDTTEVWRPVPIDAFADLYEVSNLGRVRRGARVLKGGSTKDGYRMLVLCRPTGRLSVTVHRLVSGAFVGPLPAGMVIDHVNGDKSDNRVVNLRFLTPRDNTRQASARGLMCHGERHHSARLTAADVVTIRERHRSGETFYALGKAYGVTPRAIVTIVRRLSWAHVS